MVRFLELFIYILCFRFAVMYDTYISHIPLLFHILNPQSAKEETTNLVPKIKKKCFAQAISYRELKD